ncbi:uncharacterized protein VTP21DRAFT_5885 [Calcarisporiella thermophila]|uniref:uncharacterized protein n=1 Tax=Calcarisporiella thermophila TaxID=911321 RepID=UPI0037432D2B
MSILKGALERLYAEARSTKNKELREECERSLERLNDDILTARELEERDLMNAEATMRLQAASEKAATLVEEPASSIQETDSSSAAPAASPSSTPSDKNPEIESESPQREPTEAQSPISTTRPSTGSWAGQRVSSAQRTSTSTSLLGGGSDLPRVRADAYWEPFRLAFQPGMPSKLRIVALDALQKIISHGLLPGDEILSEERAQKISNPPANDNQLLGGISENNDLSRLKDPHLFTENVETPSPFSLSDSAPGMPLPNPSIQNLCLVDEIVHTICTSYTGPSTDDGVQLQILKVLLHIVTSDTCILSSLSLLKIIQTCMNLHCYSRNMVNQTTAKAELTQIVNLLANRVETAHAAMINAPSTVETSSTDGPKEIGEDKSITKLSEKELISNEIHPNEEAVGDKTGAVEDIRPQDASTKALDKPSSDNSDSCQTEGAGLDQTNGLVQPSDAPESTELTNAAAELAPNDPTNEADVPSETKEESEHITIEAPSPSEPAQASSIPEEDLPTISPEPQRRPELTPHQCYCIIRNQTLAVIRLLCDFSMCTDASITTSTKSAHDVEELSLRTRTLALELILSMLNNADAVFYTLEPAFISIIRQHLCVSLSRNGVSANPQLFELSLSIFLMLLRHFRAPLKSELEVLFNEIYLQFLDMSNASFQQKSMILQGLTKICSNPRTLVDIYLNYDCDLGSASIFERTVTLLSKLAQGRQKPQGSTMGSVIGAHASALLLDNRADLAMIQEKRLRVRALRCLVGVMKSLVEWGRLGGSPSTSSGSGSALNGHMASGENDNTHASTATPHAKGSHNRELTGDSAEKEESTSPGLDPHANLNQTTVTSLEESEKSSKSRPVILPKNPLQALSMNDLTRHPNLSSASVHSMNGSSADGEDHPSQIEQMMSRKQLLLKGILLFNSKPTKGMRFLIEHGFVEDTPDAQVTFLLTTGNLSKAAIGEYLGEGDAANIQIMHGFVDRQDFTGLGIVEALRRFLQTFRLPGESQKIDRILEKFADRYCETNPDAFTSADTAFFLCYSIIILNTDQHSPQVKNRMDKAAFIRNNRGGAASSDLSDEFLLKIFDEIVANEIVMEEEQVHKDKEAAPGGPKQQELYQRETLQMQKKSQQLLLSYQQRATSDSSLTTAYRSATHAEHVKPMFMVACWPLMATLSLVFEEAVPEESAAQDYSRANSETVTLCLDGFSCAIRISSIFRMATERDAFVSSLAKLTGLNHLDEMRPKNVAAIRTLLHVANPNVLGEYLDASWVTVLRTISQMESLQLISANAGRQRLEGLELRGVDYESRIENEEEKKPFPRAQQRRGSVSAPMREVQSQQTLVAIDQIFANTMLLSGDAIVHFFRALCNVSTEEVRSARTPRMFSLRRIVEIAYYNMGRIRFEWIPIWKILQPHFETVGSHPNADVATFAVDSLRQLSMKFLDRDELARYHTQNEFLKPFEHIVRRSPSFAIRDLVIQSLVQMITARARNIKSGWRSIFVVLGHAASDANHALVEYAFGAVQMVHQKYMSLLGAAFVDYVGCLVEFVFHAKEEDVVLDAVKLLGACAKRLTAEMVPPEETEGAKEVTAVRVVVEETEEAQAKSTKHLEEEQFFLRWFPVVSALSRVAIDGERPRVRAQSLETLFELLFAAGHVFDPTYWHKLYRNTLMPVFEEIRMGQKRSVEVAQALRGWVNVFCAFRTTLAREQELLAETLDLLVQMTRQNREDLGAAGIGGFHQLLKQCGSLLNEQGWESTTYALEALFAATLPRELMLTEIKEEEPERSEEKIRAREAEFRVTLAKCSLHLHLLAAVRDAMLSDTSFHPMAARPKPADQLPEPKAGSTPKATTPTSPAPPSSQSVALSEPLGLHVMPRKLRPRWVHCLRTSFQFAREFNDNMGLRTYLLRKGYIPQLPNLVKQETMALSTYLSLLFDLHRWVHAEHPPSNTAEDELADFEQTVVEEEREREEVTSQLLEESKRILDRFVAVLSAEANHPREVANLAPLVVVVFKELLRTAWTGPQSSSRVRQEIPAFFRSGIKMVGVERGDVRGVLQEFMERIAENLRFEF